MSGEASSAGAEGRRREVVWAWLSLIALVIAWDRAGRLDERPSAPRVRIAHAVSREEAAHGGATTRLLTE